MSAADPYIYAGTNVLINKLNIRDGDELARAERLIARTRSRERLPDLKMTAAGFRQVHEHLFGDIYPWAGQHRTVGIGKGNTTFMAPRFIDGAMDYQFRQLAAEKFLRGLDRERFAARAAHHICELNHIHPFRDGNGRTMRFFLRELADRAGFVLAISLMAGKDWIRASIEGTDAGRLESMTEIIAASLVRRGGD
ncbi:MAG: Fic family protein [Alphaproteobacteria bacterium]|nr:Fic family protein [Alphaproteobacteria bacterium]